MKKVYFIFVAVLLFLCVVYNILVGQKYIIEANFCGYTNDTEQLQISIEQDREIVKILDYQIKHDKIYISLESVSLGKAKLFVTTVENNSKSLLYCSTIYVHLLGVVTEENFFGRSTGSWVFRIAVTIFLSIAITSLFVHIEKELHRNFYQYKNVNNIGFLLFLIGLFAKQISLLNSTDDGIMDSIMLLLDFVSSFSMFFFPAIFIIFILVTISNIQIMINEGCSRKNIFDCILGTVICLGIIFSTVIGELLKQNVIVNMYSEKHFMLYIKLFIENAILGVTAYLECVFIGTIVMSIKATQKIPTFDKDYIIILGCQIKRDGTLTNLLKSRTDRAIEFANMQKNATGKDIIFLPSGGKGKDEIISEADAIKNYLIETGISESNILVENKSTSTYENLRNSMNLICSNEKNDNPKIVFSTTNYHVFRSGIIASQQGIMAEGIGSKTKKYFLINAFIREFTATFVSEWKTHITIIMAWFSIIIIIIGIIFFSNNF